MNACSEVLPPPAPYSPFDYPVNWILLARRGDCNFQTKIENAESANYKAILIYNVGSNKTENWGVEDPSGISIYASLIGEYNGLVLSQNFTYHNP